MYFDGGVFQSRQRHFREAGQSDKHAPKIDKQDQSENQTDMATK